MKSFIFFFTITSAFVSQAYSSRIAVKLDSLSEQHYKLQAELKLLHNVKTDATDEVIRLTKGKTPGVKKQISQFNELIADTNIAINEIRSQIKKVRLQYPPVPTFAETPHKK